MSEPLRPQRFEDIFSKTVVFFSVTESAREYSAPTCGPVRSVFTEKEVRIQSNLLRVKMGMLSYTFTTIFSVVIYLLLAKKVSAISE